MNQHKHTIFGVSSELFREARLLGQTGSSTPSANPQTPGSFEEDPTVTGVLEERGPMRTLVEPVKEALREASSGRDVEDLMKEDWFRYAMQALVTYREGIGVQIFLPGQIDTTHPAYRKAKVELLEMRTDAIEAVQAYFNEVFKKKLEAKKALGKIDDKDRTKQMEQALEVLESIKDGEEQRKMEKKQLITLTVVRELIRASGKGLKQSDAIVFVQKLFDDGTRIKEDEKELAKDLRRDLIQTISAKVKSGEIFASEHVRDHLFPILQKFADLPPAERHKDRKLGDLSTKHHDRISLYLGLRSTEEQIARVKGERKRFLIERFPERAEVFYLLAGSDAEQLIGRCMRADYKLDFETMRTLIGAMGIAVPADLELNANFGSDIDNTALTDIEGRSRLAPGNIKEFAKKILLNGKHVITVEDLVAIHGSMNPTDFSQAVAFLFGNDIAKEMTAKAINKTSKDYLQYLQRSKPYLTIEDGAAEALTSIWNQKTLQEYLKNNGYNNPATIDVPAGWRRAGAPEDAWGFLDDKELDIGLGSLYAISKSSKVEKYPDSKNDYVRNVPNLLIEINTIINTGGDVDENKFKDLFAYLLSENGDSTPESVQAAADLLTELKAAAGILTPGTTTIADQHKLDDFLNNVLISTEALRDDPRRGAAGLVVIDPTTISETVALNDLPDLSDTIMDLVVDPVTGKIDEAEVLNIFAFLLSKKDDTPGAATERAKKMLEDFKKNKLGTVNFLAVRPDGIYLAGAPDAAKMAVSKQKLRTFLETNLFLAPGTAPGTMLQIDKTVIDKLKKLRTAGFLDLKNADHAKLKAREFFRILRYGLGKYKNYWFSIPRNFYDPKGGDELQEFNDRWDALDNYHDILSGVISHFGDQDKRFAKAFKKLYEFSIQQHTAARELTQLIPVTEEEENSKRLRKYMIFFMEKQERLKKELEPLWARYDDPKIRATALFLANRPNADPLDDKALKRAKKYLDNPYNFKFTNEEEKGLQGFLAKYYKMQILDEEDVLLPLRYGLHVGVIEKAMEILRDKGLLDGEMHYDNWLRNPAAAEKPLREILYDLKGSKMNGKNTLIKVFCDKRKQKQKLGNGEELDFGEAQFYVDGIRQHLKRQRVDFEQSPRQLARKERFTSPLEFLRAGADSVRGMLQSGDRVKQGIAIAMLVTGGYVLWQTWKKKGIGQKLMIGIPLFFGADIVTREMTGRGILERLSLTYMNKKDRNSAIEQFMRRHEKDENYEELGTKAGFEAVRQLMNPDSPFPVSKLLEWRNEARKGGSGSSFRDGAPEGIEGAARKVKSKFGFLTNRQYKSSDEKMEMAYEILLKSFEALCVDVAQANRSATPNVERGMQIIRERYVDFTAEHIQGFKGDLQRVAAARPNGGFSMLDVLVFERPTAAMTKDVIENETYLEMMLRGTGIAADFAKKKIRHGTTLIGVWAEHFAEKTPGTLESAGEALLETADDAWKYLRRTGARVGEDVKDNFRTGWQILKRLGGKIKMHGPGVGEVILDTSIDVTANVITEAKKLHDWIKTFPEARAVMQPVEEWLMKIVGYNYMEELITPEGHEQNKSDFDANVSFYDGGTYQVRDVIDGGYKLEDRFPGERTPRILFVNSAGNALNLTESEIQLEEWREHISEGIFGPTYGKLRPSQQRFVLEVMQANIFKAVAADKNGDMQKSAANYRNDVNNLQAVFDTAEADANIKRTNYDNAVSAESAAKTAYENAWQDGPTLQKLLLAEQTRLANLNIIRSNQIKELTRLQAITPKTQDIKDQIANLRNALANTVADANKLTDSIALISFKINIATKAVDDLRIMNTNHLSQDKKDFVKEKIKTHDDHQRCISTKATAKTAKDRAESAEKTADENLENRKKKGADVVHIKFKDLLWDSTNSVHTIELDILKTPDSVRKQGLFEHVFSQKYKLFEVELEKIFGKSMSDADYTAFRSSVEAWRDRRIDNDKLYLNCKDNKLKSAYRRYLDQVALNEVFLRTMMESPRTPQDGELGHPLHLSVAEGRYVDQRLQVRERTVSFAQFVELWVSVQSDPNKLANMP